MLWLLWSSFLPRLLTGSDNQFLRRKSGRHHHTQEVSAPTGSTSEKVTSLRREELMVISNHFHELVWELGYSVVDEKWGANPHPLPALRQRNYCILYCLSWCCVTKTHHVPVYTAWQRLSGHMHSVTCHCGKGNRCFIAQVLWKVLINVTDVWLWFSGLGCWYTWVYVFAARREGSCFSFEHGADSPHESTSQGSLLCHPSWHTVSALILLIFSFSLLTSHPQQEAGLESPHTTCQSRKTWKQV